jgi:hypothetical protein
MNIKMMGGITIILQRVFLYWKLGSKSAWALPAPAYSTNKSKSDRIKAKALYLEQAVASNSL